LVISEAHAADLRRPEATLDDARPHSPESHRANALVSRLLDGALWVGLTRLFGIGTTVLLNVLLAKLLDPADFGVFMLVASLSAFCSSLGMFGLNGALVRFISENLGLGDRIAAVTVLWRGMRLAFISTGIVAIAAWLVLGTWGEALFGLPDAAWIAAMIAFTMLLLTFSQLIAESLRGFHELRMASLLSGGQSGGLAGNLVFLALLSILVCTESPTLNSVLGLNAAALLVVLPLGFIGLRSVTRKIIETTAPQNTTILPAGVATIEYSTLVATCLPLMLVGVASFASTQADVWIAGSCFSHDDLALYTAARRLMLIMAMPLQVAMLTVLASIPQLSSQRRLTELQRLLRSASMVAVVPSLIAISVLLLWGETILSWMFGDFYRGAFQPLLILGVGQVLLAWFGLAHFTLAMTGRQRPLLIVSLITAAALMICGPLAARKWGINGLAATSASLLVMEAATQWLLTRRLCGVWTHAAFGLSQKSIATWLGYAKERTRRMRGALASTRHETILPSDVET
jgi:O-antigen/teichoic acid export membrane protein